MKQHRTKGRNRSRAVRMAGAAAILALILAAPAAAASKPGVTTGGAREVSYASAALTGTVNPNAQNTSYYFQYGPTKAYGGQSAISDAGSGSKGVSVKVAVGGLQPITVYHYRLVAVNASGATIGSDHTFTTTKVPLSLEILASPNPVCLRWSRGHPGDALRHEQRQSPDRPAGQRHSRSPRASRMSATPS